VTVAATLTTLATIHAGATLRRWVAAIGRAHAMAGTPLGGHAAGDPRHARRHRPPVWHPGPPRHRHRHLTITPEGLRLLIPLARGDQEGRGAGLGSLPGAQTETCPVRANTRTNFWSGFTASIVLEVSEIADA
jgi:hypothetical protein